MKLPGVESKKDIKKAIQEAIYKKSNRACSNCKYFLSKSYCTIYKTNIKNIDYYSCSFFKEKDLQNRY